jgi:glycosyltransferase involved in cell wall biosynthesis
LSNSFSQIQPQRIAEHDWTEEIEPLVSIVCFSYNHESFIEQCIEGFLLQETTFPVEIVIHDDASPDKTAAIIRNYHSRFPKLIRPILQSENQMQKGRNLLPMIMGTSRGAYIAICEGDDYWISPNKLQQQVEHMENDLRLSMCCHAVQLVGDASITELAVRPIPSARSPVHGPESFFKFDNFVHTCSVIIRKSCLGDIPQMLDGFPFGDWPLFLLISLRGPVAYLDKVMASYRIHSGGMWSGANSNRKMAMETIMWKLLLPLLPNEFSVLARERITTLYMSQFNQAESLGLRARCGLAFNWLWSSIMQGTVRRKEFNYVFGVLLRGFRRLVIP